MKDSAPGPPARLPGLASLLRLLFFFLTFLLLLPLPVRTEAEALLRAPYRIKAGDTLMITVVGEATLSRSVVVRPDGKISFPFLGDLQVEGLTPLALRKALSDSLKTYLTRPEVVIDLVRVHDLYVRVIGKVQRPGTFPIHEGETVSGLIANAGGTLPDAAEESTSLFRDNEEIHLDLKEILNGKVHNDLPLQEGDILFVPERKEKVLVLGEVSRPGFYPVKGGETVIEVILRAGGFSDKAGNKIAVLRGAGLPSPDAKPLQLTVDYGKIIKQKEMSRNIPLSPGDVVIVPQKKAPLNLASFLPYLFLFTRNVTVR